MSHDGKQKRRGGKSGNVQSGEEAPCTVRPCQTCPCPATGSPAINDRKRASCLAAAAEFADALEHHGAELRKSRLTFSSRP